MFRGLHLALSLVAVGVVAGLLVLFTLGKTTADSHFEVVATGLDNPRDLDFGPEGGLYVTEAGRGGEGPCIPGPTGVPVCAGLTGAVTRIHRGEQERVATGLPSIAPEDGAHALGPQGISIHGRGSTFVAIGLGADPAERDELGEAGSDFGQLAQMAASGRLRNVADIAAHEAAENPDGVGPDSNPFRVLALPSKRLVVDAGANALFQADANGTVSTVAVFPEFPNPLLFGPPMVQSVPTSVAVGPDGAYYVSELTGFPFIEGAARIFRVVPGQEPEVYLEGFTHLVDLEFDQDGNLYVLQIASVSLFPVDTQTGRLIRVRPDDTREILLDNLHMPGGMVISPKGDAIYISDCGVCVGEGHVIRFPIPDSG